MGTKVNAQIDKSMQYTSAVNEMTALMTWRFLRVQANNEILFSILYPHKKLRQMKLIKIMHAFTQKVIEERRETLQNSLKTDSIKDNDFYDIGTKKRMALLDVLLQATIDGKPLSDEDILEEVETFMFEGHDTTTSALSFTLYLLARHPEVQNKLLAESRQVFGDNHTPSFSLMNLNELKYMESVIKESMRLYPPVPIIARDITDNFVYNTSSLGAGVIPAGTEFLISIYGMLRNPLKYKNAGDFIPERHELTAANNNFQYIPFSAGPRNCIGQKFAMYEMKIVLTKIIREYELLPLGKAVKPTLSIVMRSATGMQLGIKKRMK